MKSPDLPVTRLQPLALLLTLLAFTTLAAAQSRVECSAVRSTILKQRVRYCAILPPSYDKDPNRRYAVLYYLHGLGESEQALTGPLWNLVERVQQTGRIGEFLIVTPDADRSFYINSHDGRYRYEDFFMREFIPAIDRKYRTRPQRASRGISGTSMGGYGALRLAFKYPSRFAAVSAHMAALYEEVPQPVIDAVNQRGRRFHMGTIFGQPFDKAFYARNTPFALARANAAAIRRLKIYFDCGDQDDYAFDLGAEDLHKLLNSLKVKHEFHLYPGAHDPFYVAEHLPESLEFQSKALNAAP